MGCVLLPWTTGDVKHNGTSLTDRIVGYDTIDTATTFCDNTPTRVQRSLCHETSLNLPLHARPQPISPTIGTKKATVIMAITIHAS
jgi:hypothetical protein